MHTISFIKLKVSGFEPLQNGQNLRLEHQIYHTHVIFDVTMLFRFRLNHELQTYQARGISSYRHFRSDCEGFLTRFYLRVSVPLKNKQCIRHTE